MAIHIVDTAIPTLAHISAVSTSALLMVTATKLGLMATTTLVVSYVAPVALLV